MGARLQLWRQGEGDGGLVGEGNKGKLSQWASKAQSSRFCLPSPLFSKYHWPHLALPFRTGARVDRLQSYSWQASHSRKQCWGLDIFSTVCMQNLSALNTGGSSKCQPFCDTVKRYIFFSGSRIFSEDASNESAALKFPRLWV